MAEVAKPKSILRGHNAQVHVAVFIRRNERLATGDADGFVVLWDLTILRPGAVWRAHENSILGIAGWGNDKLITHGRDNKLIVWRLTSSDESNLSTALPLEEVTEPRPQPWIVHLLEVNTMNFCSFAYCSARPQGSAAHADELLVAVPNTVKSEAIDIFHLPSQKRRKTVESDGKNGMVMALALFHRNERLILISAYENGLTLVLSLSDDPSCPKKLLYRSQVHSQPILSLDISLEGGYFLTSGADAIIGKHPIPNPGSNLETLPVKKVDTKHAGQQSIRIRSDGKIFATAGWDARVRVYSAKTMKEVAALKWHQVGCYAVTFSELAEPQKDPEDADQSEDSTSIVQFETVKSRRVAYAQTAHWLAAGSKDGKVSLWVIY